MTKIRQCFHAVFSNLESAGVLGRRYLELYPNENSRILLLAESIEHAKIQTPEDLRDMIRQKCESDFQNDETVILDGFLLARTEIDACALIVLL